MGFKEILANAFRKKEPMIYNAQREHIDREHDALQRHLSYLQKKKEIPMMRERIKQMDKEQFGSPLRTNDKNNILKAPNHFKAYGQFKRRRGMI